MTSFLGKLIVLAATTAGLTRLSRLLRGDSGRAGSRGPRDDKTSQPPETSASVRMDAAEAVDNAAAGPAPAVPKTDAQGVTDQDVSSTSNGAGADPAKAEVAAKPAPRQSLRHRSRRKTRSPSSTGPRPSTAISARWTTPDCRGTGRRSLRIARVSGACIRPGARRRRTRGDRPNPASRVCSRISAAASLQRR